MRTNLKIIPITKPNRATHTSVDTIMVTPDMVRSWENPPFQRPLSVNAKVRALAEQIKADAGVIPGVITIGVMMGMKYKLDGQHRLEAFLISGCEEGFCDVRYRHFDSMPDMGEEFVNLNSQLVRLRPDDILRGLEGTNEALHLLRERCGFVGYDMIRRSARSPIVGMSTVLRCWYGSAPETPTTSAPSAAAIARTFLVEDAATLADFLDIAERAWGRDLEYARLWGGLNISLCMWLYRRLVIAPYSSKSPKLSKDQFRAAMTSLSAETGYLDWLVGRQLSDRDRGPAYTRIKGIFSRRLAVELGRKVYLPQPPWAAHA